VSSFGTSGNPPTLSKAVRRTEVLNPGSIGADSRGKAWSMVHSTGFVRRGPVIRHRDVAAVAPSRSTNDSIRST